MRPTRECAPGLPPRPRREPTSRVTRIDHADPAPGESPGGPGDGARRCAGCPRPWNTGGDLGQPIAIAHPVGRPDRQRTPARAGSDIDVVDLEGNDRVVRRCRQLATAGPEDDLPRDQGYFTGRAARIAPAV